MNFVTCGGRSGSGAAVQGDEGRTRPVFEQSADWTDMGRATRLTHPTILVKIAQNMCKAFQNGSKSSKTHANRVKNVNNMWNQLPPKSFKSSIVFFKQDFFSIR